MGEQRALRRWRAIALVATGVAIGSTLTSTPVYSHVGGSVGHLWKHLRPSADARYYTKARSDARYYTKSRSDARYTTRAEADARYPVRTDLATAGTINAAGNPVAWTKLNSVPTGFADGTDDTGGLASDLACTGCVGATDLADGAASAAKLGSIVTRLVTATVDDGGGGSGSATCNAGERILGGGARASTATASEIHLFASRPATTGGGTPANGAAFTHWFAAATNPTGGEGDTEMTIFAICLG